MDEIKQQRAVLKDSMRKTYDFSRTDQHKGRPAPPLQVAAPRDAPRVALPGPAEWPQDFAQCGLRDAMAARESHRKFSEEPLSLRELGFLLWSTQGLKRVIREGVAKRVVPSAGSRHAFESHIFARRVEGLEPGHYRYQPVEHELRFLGAIPGMERALGEATLGQEFCGRMAVTIVWSCVPYRMEWRYGATSSRVILMDAGHICQNLYLACEAIGAGTCAVAAYDQEKLDALAGLDGEEEFAVYLAPVGKLIRKPA